MPDAGMFTEIDAQRQGLFPARPLVRIIKEWQEENSWMDLQVAESRLRRRHEGLKEELQGTLYELAESTGISKSTLYRIVMRDKEWLEFDNADRLVCFIDPLLWHTDPELSELYREYNFANLDLSRPTHPDADPLKEVEGWPLIAAAEHLGVAPSTITQLRYTDRGAARWEPSRRGQKQEVASCLAG